MDDGVAQWPPCKPRSTRSRPFPRQLEKHYAAFPPEYVNWAPPSWDGVPSEAFTAIEQICHVRDIEIEGYQVRFRRTLDEDTPTAVHRQRSLAKQRDYAAATQARVRGVHAARAQTLALLRGSTLRNCSGRQCSKVMGA